MIAEKFKILQIVEEDILEALEKKGGKSSSLIIEPEIRVSRSFITEAIKNLRGKNLIKLEKDIVYLTEEGAKKAKDITKKHSIIENYFKKKKDKKMAYKIASILEHYVSQEVINNIKKLSTFKEEGVLLENFKHEQGLITDITSIKLFERIISMGLCPGEKIKIVKKLPNGIIVRVENKKFALGNEIANKIRVLDYKKH
jgi:Mn-dependent DtxR family transcriptional regulator